MEHIKVMPEHVCKKYENRMILLIIPTLKCMITSFWLLLDHRVAVNLPSCDL